MSLEFVKVVRGLPINSGLDEIMKRQFPPEEYMSIEDQLKLQDNGDVEIFAILDEGQIVGITTLRITDDMIYLFFLAFDDRFQGRGYGGETVRAIGKMYRDRVFAVDFELADGESGNNAQRIRRRNFYLRNGFVETGWGLEYLGVKYEIFCMNKPFDILSFKRMLNRLPISNFSPVYFRTCADEG